MCDSRLLVLLSDRADTVPGYDFLVNSVWPEMIRAIEERLSSLFNPGNPDVFYAVCGRLQPDRFRGSSASASPVALLQRYSVSMEFVRKFERQCSSQASVKRLRGHPSYTSFHSKWNLPVYFQLRCLFSTQHITTNPPVVRPTVTQHQCAWIRVSYLTTTLAQGTLVQVQTKWSNCLIFTKHTHTHRAKGLH